MCIYIYMYIHMGDHVGDIYIYTDFVYVRVNISIYLYLYIYIHMYGREDVYREISPTMPNQMEQEMGLFTKTCLNTVVMTR